MPQGHCSAYEKTCRGCRKNQPLQGSVQLNTETPAGPETTKEGQANPRHQAR